MTMGISGKAVLVNTPIRLVIVQGVVLAIIVTSIFMIYDAYRPALNNRIFLLIFLSFVGYAVYQIWKLRFYIRNSIESLLKYYPRIEFKPEGIFLYKDSVQKDYYEWDKVQDLSRTWIENENSYEIEFSTVDERLFRIYDSDDWKQFNAIQKWTANKFESEVEHCRREPITGNLIPVGDDDKVK